MMNPIDSDRCIYCVFARQAAADISRRDKWVVPFMDDLLYCTLKRKFLSKEQPSCKMDFMNRKISFEDKRAIGVALFD